MPKKIQNPESAVALQGEYGVLGKLQMALDEIIVPVSIVSDLVPDLWRPCGIAWRSGASGVGNTWRHQLYNPADSQIMIRFDSAELSMGANDVRTFFLHNTQVAAASAVGFLLDRRDAFDPASPRARGEISILAAAGTFAGNNIGATFGGANRVVRFDGPIYLLPGTGVLANQDTLDVGLLSNWRWSERPLTEAEKRKL